VTSLAHKRGRSVIRGRCRTAIGPSFSVRRTCVSSWSHMCVAMSPLYGDLFFSWCSYVLCEL
jgi:hypothetical protein